MNLPRRWTFFAIMAAWFAIDFGSAFAQLPTVPENVSQMDRFFTKQLLNDEEWSDLKLFPSINPKSRPETDPTATDEYLKLPLHFRKAQVLQLLGGLIQYRLFGIFRHEPKYHTKKYNQWIEQSPEKFNYLKIHEDRYQPKIENSLTFINSKYEYRGISDKAIGYCYGVATVFKKFAQLAFFSEVIVPEDEVPVRGSDEWYAFYMNRLAAVLKGEAAFFPGFKNIRELTTVPEFEFFLKVQVTKQWKTMATLATTLRSYLGNTKEMDAEEVSALITDIKLRLSRGEFPKILFASAISKTFLTGGARTHAVLVNKVEELPEQKITRIHIWDINFYGEDLVQRPYFIEVRYDDNGVPNIHYQEWANPSHDTKRKYLRTEIPGDRIGKVLVAAENNREVVDTIRSIEKFCKNPPAGHPEIKNKCPTPFL